MRLIASCLILLSLVVGICPLPSVAEDTPPAEAEKPASEEGGWDGDAFWFAKLIVPSEVMGVVTARLQDVPRSQRRSAQAKLIKEYLAVWSAHGPEAATLAPEELLSAYRLHTVVLDYPSALATLQAVLEREELEAGSKDAAMSGLASLLGNSRTHEALGDEALKGLAETITAYLDERTEEGAGKVRGAIHAALARYADKQDDDEASMRHNVQSAVEDPSRAAGVARTLVRSMQSSTHDLEAYDPLRATMAGVLPVLKQLAERHLASVKEGTDARAISYAERGLAMLETVDRPLGMLGRPAQDWTLERAFGDVKALGDLKGKVVILDFWATWCPWCIKSFPAIRDLLKDYAPEDLAVVGVTASASAVYEQRWDLDDDLKEKADGQRPTPAARLARGTAAPDPEKKVFAEAEFRQEELKALAKFIQNHEMSWPVVMIDKEEPGPKFAVGGWPHAVVLDREGRIRYFKVGALLRDRPEAVAAFRAILDDLIAEKAEEPADPEKTKE